MLVNRKQRAASPEGMCGLTRRTTQTRNEEDIMSKLGTTALLLVVAISASDAQACGEVMYRVGGALRYHAFITRIRAKILLNNVTAAQQAATADSQRFHENLEKAGHKVTVVDGPDALTKALGERSYDVIITYAGDLPAIREQITHVTREPA